MSVLNQKNLGAAFAGSSSESLTWFFIQGEAVKNKKNEIIYKRKTEGKGKDKKEASEEYLQVTRTVDESGKQTLRLYYNEDVVAWFDFTKSGASFSFSDKWQKPKSFVVMPVDPTFETIIGNDISDIFDEWMTSDRFEEFLFRQSSKLKYRTLFTRAILLFLSFLEHRKVEKERGDIFIPANGAVDMAQVARTFTLKLTKLANSSARAKELFPVIPMLEAGKEEETPQVESPEPTEKSMVEVEPTTENLPEPTTEPEQVVVEVTAESTADYVDQAKLATDNIKANAIKNASK